MKILILLFFVLASYNTIGKSQPFNLPQIAVKDIEKGFSDIDYFRCILKEKGFVYDNKEVDEKQNTEHWCIKRSINAYQYDTPYPIVWAQMSTWFYEGKTLGKSIYLALNKELLSTEGDTYANELFQKVKITFPIKETRPFYKDREMTVLGGYNVYYLRKGSKIEVTYNEDDTFYRFSFKLTY